MNESIFIDGENHLAVCFEDHALWFHYSPVLGDWWVRIDSGMPRKVESIREFLEKVL